MRYFSDSRRYGAKNPFLDEQMVAQRIRVSLELFLFDSDYRCKVAKRRGFCHLVGLGAGYWSFCKSMQDLKMCDVALDIIADSDLRHLSFLYFAWFDDECRGNAKLKKANDGELFVKDKNGHRIAIGFG